MLGNHPAVVRVGIAGLGGEWDNLEQQNEMKNFTTGEIRDLFNRVMIDEISFSRMVEVINQRISESEVREYKDGDFLHSDWENENITLICKKQRGDKIYTHAYKSNTLGVSFDKTYWRNDGNFRPATEAEKQELLDAIAKEGKRWNAEKLCVEDTPEELKKGDLAIFWDFNKGSAFIGEYECFLKDTIYPHSDHRGNVYANALKFESKEQYEKLLKGEI